MKFVLGSAFRNSSSRVAGYMEQAARLRDSLKMLATLRVVAVEGDSTDDTRERLTSEAARHELDLALLTVNHGGPEYGSVESVERMAALSQVGNAIFSAVREDESALFYVESDLIWDADTAIALLFLAVNHAARHDVFAPLVMAGEHFYDIWAFRGLDGRRFSPFKPFYPGVDKATFLEVGSVGSCLAVPGTVARKCRIRDENCLVGWCADARNFGYKIAVVPSYEVRHP